jgi:hypothetical protein
MICHLRALDSIEVDPFSEEARMGRNYVRGLVFPSNQMRIVMPEEVGDTRFVEFVFADELEEARVMGSVEERGFGNFITSTVEE